MTKGDQVVAYGHVGNLQSRRLKLKARSLHHILITANCATSSITRFEICPARVTPYIIIFQNPLW
jgi:hypothetical protein